MSFAVEKYRKPEFRVVVWTDKPHYVQGEKMVCTIAAEYLFGGAVKDGKVIYVISRSRFKMDLFAEAKSNMYMSAQEFEFFKEEIVRHGEGRLNDDGRIVIEFETEKMPFDCAYRVVATVSDASGAFVSGSTSVNSTLSELTLGIHTDKSLYKIEDVMKVSVR
ncbi:MAG: hypothetical protein N2234_09640, partial [Planctomycetota bacterium]|nr:hypothetical protein [Planctomycetota bacterium]